MSSEMQIFCDLFYHTNRGELSKPKEETKRREGRVKIAVRTRLLGRSKVQQALNVCIHADTLSIRN